MENFKEPLPQFRWLPEAFFRLHRRRQFHQTGYQPIPYQEMADFAERILRLHPSVLPLFYRVIEETDNGVLYDSYMKTSADIKDAQDGAKSPPKRTKRRGG